MRDPILLIHSKTFIESYIFCLMPGDDRKTKNVWADRTPLECFAGQCLHSERNTVVLLGSKATIILVKRKRKVDVPPNCPGSGYSSWMEEVL